MGGSQPLTAAPGSVLAPEVSECIFCSTPVGAPVGRETVGPFVPVVGK